MRIGGVLIAVLALGVCAEDARAQEPDDAGATESFTIFSEIDVTDGAYFVGTELYAALNGDWSKPGFLLHAYIGSGQYDYLNSAVRGGRVDAVPISADLLVGYQGSIGDDAAYWNVMIGVGIEDNELDPGDPSNPVRGSEVGFKVAGELEADDERKFYYHLEADYTTAYDTYWSRARVGYRFGRVILGPEGTFFGDETYNSQRIGGYLRVPLRMFWNFEPVAIVAGGYECVQEEDAGPSGTGFGGIGGSGDGGYGTASLQFDF
jgi:Cellulose biosynthesis protein BcsS